MRPGTALLAIVVCLGGCSKFQGLSNPRVVHAMALHVPEPDAVTLPPDIVYDGVGTWVTAQLIDADGTLAVGIQIPIEAADVFLVDHTGEDYAALPLGGGLFEVGPPLEHLEYVSGEEWQLDVLFEEDVPPGHLTLELPPPAPVNIPENVPVGQPLFGEVDGPGFATFLGFVYGIGGGLTWFGVPDFEELTVEDLDRIEVPGRSFPTAGTYVVGIAPMRVERQVDSLNTKLSAAITGAISYHTVTAN